MIFTKKTFSKRQIKRVEKVKQKLLKDISMFEDILQLIEQKYCITPRDADSKKYSTQWLKDMKDAINNIDLENEKIAGKKVENGKYATLLHDYFMGISIPVVKEFYKLDGTILELVNEYQKQIIRILV